MRLLSTRCNSGLPELLWDILLPFDCTFHGMDWIQVLLEEAVCSRTAENYDVSEQDSDFLVYGSLDCITNRLFLNQSVRS